MIDLLQIAYDVGTLADKMPAKRVIDDDRKLGILASVYLGKQVSLVRPLTAQ